MIPARDIFWAAIPLLSVGPVFAEHIIVAKEVMLEVAQPKAIARAPDGGYLIAGHVNYSAWATKVDQDGKVIWRQDLPGSSVNPCCGGTQYRGITFLSDRSALLCGTMDVTAPATEGRPRPQILGLTVVVNAQGEIVRKQTLTPPQLIPAGQTDQGLNYLDQCATSGDGAIAVGSGYRLSGDPNRIAYFTWLVGLDRSGAVTSNKVISIPVPSQNQPVSMNHLFATPRGDFLMVDPSHDAVRFKKDGTIEATGRIEIPIMLSSGPEEPMRAIAQLDSSDIVTTDADIQVVDRKKGKDWQFIRSAAYRLSNGSIASFGSTEMYGGTAAVEWLSPDAAFEEIKIFMPTHGSGQVDAVAPTSRADEFATVRLVIPGLRHKVGPDETRSGVLLTFLRFQ